MQPGQAVLQWVVLGRLPCSGTKYSTHRGPIIVTKPLTEHGSKSLADTVAFRFTVNLTIIKPLSITH